jgi:hypothetical protein
LGVKQKSPRLSKTGAFFIFIQGDDRIRTGDQDFADPCLTTWLRRRLLFLSLCIVTSLPKFATLLMQGNLLFAPHCPSTTNEHE